jgi:DNA-binding MarR family transcriptional regulator
MPLKLIPELNRAALRVGIYIAAAPDLEITTAEAQLLSQLDSGAKGVGELQAACGHKRSTLTSILDRLVARDLITREVPEEDRRSVVVRPTRTGKVVARRSREYLAKLEGRVARRVSARALAGYHEVIRAIELETPDSV